MKCVVLDGYTCNPGDLSWDGLAALTDLTVYERSTPEEVIPRSLEAEALLVNKVPLNDAMFDQLPHLSYIGVTATGYNIIDIAAARQKGIVVTHVPSYGTAAVVQHTFALLLAMTNRTATYMASVQAGEWSQAPDFTYFKAPVIELAGLTLGVVGLGAIGQGVARVGHALGMEVMGWNHRPKEVPHVRAVDLATLFSQADVVSLHLAQTPSTYQLVDQAMLKLMKPTAFLLNTARGGLIDEQALVHHLRSGNIAGAALDVLEEEPPAQDHPLLHLPNCWVTPHIAWASRAARARLIQMATENVQAFLAGTPQHVVSI